VSDLVGDGGAGLGADPAGEGVGFLEHEAAVEEIERLQWRGGFAASGGALAGIGAVERAEDRLAFASDLVGVDHAPAALVRVGIDRQEAGEAAAFVEEVEAATEHGEVQPAAGGEYGVADGFGFEPAGGGSARGGGRRRRGRRRGGSMRLDWR
jgi:hypothetical protein